MHDIINCIRVTQTKCRSLTNFSTVYGNKLVT